MSLSTLRQMFRDHWRLDFSWPYYSSVAIFLAASLAANHVVRFETVIDRHAGTVARTVGYLLLYGLAYYGGLGLTRTFKRGIRPRLNRRFWVVSLCGLFILAIDSGCPHLSNLFAAVRIDTRPHRLAESMLDDALGLVFVAVALSLIYPCVPEFHREGYGLLKRRSDVKLYFWILLLLMPLVAGASFIDSFADYYPTYKSHAVSDTSGIPIWEPWMVYELSYGMGFVSVELLFRGFMVVGLSRWLGSDAIMPMVVTYCFLHFGKPSAEAISAIVGGYVLGILAMYTRGIWGGTILHVGIAWCMELVAYVQQLPHGHTA